MENSAGRAELQLLQGLAIPDSGGHHLGTVLNEGPDERLPQHDAGGDRETVARDARHRKYMAPRFGLRAAALADLRPATAPVKLDAEVPE